MKLIETILTVVIGIFLSLIVVSYINNASVSIDRRIKLSDFYHSSNIISDYLDDYNSVESYELSSDSLKITRSDGNVLILSQHMEDGVMLTESSRNLNISIKSIKTIEFNAIDYVKASFSNTGTTELVATKDLIEIILYSEYTMQDEYEQIALRKVIQL